VFKKIVDLKKGDRVLLSYGEQNGDIASCGTFDRFIQLDFNGSSFKAWEAEVLSNPRGKDPTVVNLLVHGFGEDMGDTYAHSIIGWMSEIGTWEPIEHTAKQKKMAVMERAMM